MFLHSGLKRVDAEQETTLVFIVAYLSEKYFNSSAKVL